MDKPVWKEVNYADLCLFASAVNNWRNTIGNVADMKLLLSEPFFLRALFPGVARKMKMGIVIAAEINVYKIPISSLKHNMQPRYLEAWNDDKIPMSFYRTTGPSIGSISREVLDRDEKRQYKVNVEDIKFYEFSEPDTTYDQWLNTIIEHVSTENLMKFKTVIENSPVGFAHSANKAVQDIKDPKERYMRLLDMIVSLAKFGPIEDCQIFGKYCYEIDTMSVDKCDPQFWMDDDIRLKCLTRIDNDRKIFASKMKTSLTNIKLDVLKATIIHLGSLIYVFNQFQLPLAKDEEEAIQMKLNYNDPYKQMILEIQGEIEDQ